MEDQVKEYEINDIKKILKRISHSQLLKILKKWDPILPINRKQNSIKTLCFYLNVEEKDGIVPLSSKQYSDLINWAEYSEFRNVRSWEKIDCFKKLNLSRLSIKNMNRCLHSIINTDEEIQGDIKSGRHYKVQAKKREKEIWIEFAFDLPLQAKEIWIRRYEYISPVSRIRAKINSKGEVFISGRNKYKSELLLSCIKACLKDHLRNEIIQKKEEVLTQKDIKSIITKLPRGENIETLSIELELPGIDVIAISFNNYKIGMKTLSDNLQIDIKNKNVSVVDVITNKRKLGFKKREIIID